MSIPNLIGVIGLNGSGKSTFLHMLALLEEPNKGKIYLSFPSVKTLNFPKRLGCLNYYDDPTHKDLPPDFNLILEIMKVL